MPRLPIRLGVNVDHVATIRNARGGDRPDPVRAALAAIEAGADGITAHLREDRRHIRDEDMRRLKAEISKPLNFEMAATPEMMAIVLEVRPHAACLVPEKRSERTTEGGLDVVGARKSLASVVPRLTDAGIRVSLFIEPDEAALETAAALGAPVVELHTGSWCEAAMTGDRSAALRELARLQRGARIGTGLGLEVHAGHGLDYETAEILAATSDFVEFNIGHFLIGEAIFVGMDASIGRMIEAMAAGRARAEAPAA
jgi:pyridoxine 5-phosphate synthase